MTAENSYISVKGTCPVEIARAMSETVSDSQASASTGRAKRAADLSTGSLLSTLEIKPQI